MMYTRAYQRKAWFRSGLERYQDRLREEHLKIVSREVIKIAGAILVVFCIIFVLGSR